MPRFTDFTFGLTHLMVSFHQDWSNEADSEIEFVENMLQPEYDPRQVVALLRDASLLFEKLPSEKIEILWMSGLERSGANFFGPAVGSGREWMGLIVEACLSWLHRFGHLDVKVEPIDMDDGIDLIGPIRDEITRCIDSLGQATISAIDDCALACSPELAFRFLMCALSHESHMCVSLQQYQRFQRIGEDLSYGEFVVSDVAHVVIDPLMCIARALEVPGNHGRSTFAEYVAYVTGIDELSNPPVLRGFDYWLACKYEGQLSLSFKEKVTTRWDQTLMRVLSMNSSGQVSHRDLAYGTMRREWSRSIYNEIDEFLRNSGKIRFRDLLSDAPFYVRSFTTFVNPSQLGSANVPLFSYISVLERVSSTPIVSFR